MMLTQHIYSKISRCLFTAVILEISSALVSLRSAGLDKLTVNGAVNCPGLGV